MKHYQIMPHVADVRALIQGSTLEELFTAGLEAMAYVIAPNECGEPYTVQEEITVISVDTTILLIDFLSEVLTKTHVTSSVFCTVTFTSLTPTSLHATVHGKKVTTFDEDIKAVTYHEAEVIKNEQGLYQTNIIFDI